jgi:hypothetical protein
MGGLDSVGLTEVKQGELERCVAAALELQLAQAAVAECEPDSV